jgi:hypothetical protein
MRRSVIANLAGILLLSACSPVRTVVPAPSGGIPHLHQRLKSSRWEVRYCLLRELTGRDLATKRVLERLARDEHARVANQALVRYVNRFVSIDKAVFRPAVFVPGRFPVHDLPERNPERVLVDYCLGRRPRELTGLVTRNCTIPNLWILDPAKRDDPEMVATLTIVGILGDRKDAKALHPFLRSTNDYVVLNAAKAVIRLGDRARGVEALSRLTESDPREHLYYVTEALWALIELGHPELETLVTRVLAAVERTEGIKPNWLSEFLLAAAQAADADVWR